MSDDPPILGAKPVTVAGAADPRMLTGDAILQTPPGVPAVWGDGARVAWSEGEPLLITGPPGVCKSTACQQLVLARIGIGPGELLGMAVVIDGRALYLAADRPQQVLRSMRRMVGPKDEDTLRERLSIWRGPLDFDIGTDPTGLVDLAASVDAQTVVIDSLYNIAARTSEDQSGGGAARALGAVIAADIELVVIHHTRKAGTDNRNPETLADVYGATWLGAAAGSVVGFFGKPGGTQVRCKQLKAPAEQVPDLAVELDKANGWLHNLGGVVSAEQRKLEAERQRIRDGVIAAITDQPGISAAGIEKAVTAKRDKVRDVLAQLVDDGVAWYGGGGGNGKPTHYHLTAQTPPQGVLTNLAPNAGARWGEVPRPDSRGEVGARSPRGGHKARHRAETTSPTQSGRGAGEATRETLAPPGPPLGGGARSSGGTNGRVDPDALVNQIKTTFDATELPGGEST